MKRNTLLLLITLLSTTIYGQRLQWVGGTGGTDEDRANSIVVDASGNTYTTGYFIGTADFNPDTSQAGTYFISTPSVDKENVFIQKLNSSGAFMWAKSLSGVDYGTGNSITVDATGNIYLTGYYSGVVDFNPGTSAADTFYLTSIGAGENTFVLKLNSSGNFVWAKGLEGTEYSEGVSLTVDASSNVIVTGTYYGTVDFNPDTAAAAVSNLTANGDGDVFVLKLNSVGNFVWAKSFGSTADDFIGGVVVDNTSNIYLAGSFYSTVDFDPDPSPSAVFNLTTTGNGDNVFVLKLSSSGVFQWAARLGGNQFADALSIAIDASNSIYTTGYFSGTVDFNPDPAGAAVFNITATGLTDQFISKLNTSGGFVWAKSIGGNEDVNGTSIATDASSNVYTTGYLSGTADFNTGTAATDTFFLTTQSGREVFISKYNSSGNFIWAANLHGDDESIGNSVSADNSGNAYVSGMYRGVVDFDPDSLLNYELTSSNGGEDIFVLKLCSPPQAAGSVTGLSAVCNGVTTSYSIGSVAGATNYTWTAPTGATIISGQGTNTINVTFGTTSGNLIVTPSNACGAGVSGSLAVTVNTRPTVGANASPSATVCSGTSVTLSGSGASTYSWSGGITNGLPFSANTTSSYTVTGTSANGCTNTSSITVNVNQPPAVGITVAPSTTVCSGSSVTLSGTGAASYSWSGGITNGVSFTPVSTATYTVTGTAANSCTGSSSTTITVNSVPSAAGAISGSTAFCNGATAAYSISPVNGASSYTWTAPAGATIVSGQNTTSIQVTFGANSGNITVTPVNACGNGTSSTLATTLNPGLAPTVSFTASPSTSICAGGSVTLSGTGANSYVWTGGITNNVSFSPATTTTYTVTGTGANGCTNSDVAVITVNPNPIVGSTVSPSSTVCSSTPVTLSGTGATTYSWSGGVTNNVAFTPVATTTYTVTGTSGGCSGTATVSITVNPRPTVGSTASPSTNICSGKTVTLSGTGASSYSWSGGVIDGVAFATSSTQSYTVTGTGANGCTNTSAVTITVISSPAVGITVSPSSTICPGNSVTLSGTGASSYTWTGGITNGTPFVPVSTSSYTVTGTAANGCTNTNITTVTLAPTPAAAGSIAGPTSLCNGATATYSIGPVSGATSYTWTVPAGSSITSGQGSTAINITFGSTTGNVTVTPVNTCGNGTASSLTVSNNPSLAPTVGFTASPSTTVCSGTAVTLTGTGASTYSWTGGISNGVSFLPLSTASYTVTGTGANGCTNSSIVTVTVNPVPTVGSTASPATTVCAGTAVTLSGTGATNYSWSGGVTNGTPFVPLSSATYSVTGTSGGCSGSSTITITVNPKPNVGISAVPAAVVCSGNSVALSGTGAVSYSWSGGITNGTAFVPPSTTTYTVTGTGANTCTNTSSVTVTVNSNPTVGSTVSPSSLVCPGTTVTLNGTGAVSYSWSGGITNGVSFVPVATTTYTVTGTNGSGCTASNTSIVTVSPAPAAAGTISGPSSLCNGASGTYSIASVSGATTYTWTVPSGSTILSGQNSTSINITFGPNSGNITVTPGNSCGSGTPSSLMVTQNAGLAPTVGFTASPATSVCTGTSVILTGTGASSYTWTGGITNGTSFLPGTTSSYTVTGTGANGCTNSSTVTITVNPIPTVGTSVLPGASVCSGLPVTLNGTGATSYSWTGGITNGVAFTPVATTTYTVTGTSSGCSATNSVVVTVNPRPTVNINVSPASTVCSGVSVTLSGSGASSYSWTGGVNNGVAFIPSATSTYTVTGTAANGCTNTSATTVTVNASPVVGYTSSPGTNVCPGTIVVLSGTGAASYTWSGGITNGISFIPVSTTTYTVTGIAANGCTDTDTVTLTVESPLSPTGAVSGPSTLCNGASATYSISPVSGATSYSWTVPGGTTIVSGQNTTSIQIVFGNTSGDVSVIPANACGTGTQSTLSITVNPNLAPSVGYSLSPSNAICAGTSVTLTGTGAVSYTWSGGINNGVSFTPGSTNTYTVTGTGANGCTNTSAVTVTVNSIPVVGVTVLPSVNICEGDSVSLSGTGAFTYAWSGGVTDGVYFTPTVTSTYSVTGDASGCIDSTTVSIRVNTRPVVGYTVSPFSTVCEGTAITLNGTGANSYTWSGGVNDGSAFVPVSSGAFIVTGTDTTGCSSTATVNVVVNPIPVFGAQPADQIVFEGSTAIFIASTSNPGTNYQWQIDSLNGFIDLINAGPFAGAQDDTLTVGATLNLDGYRFRCIATNGSCSDTTVIALLLVNPVGIAIVSDPQAYFVFPNPTYDLLNLHTLNGFDVENYRLHDGAGKVVMQGTTTGRNTTIDIGHLSAGFYLLQVGEISLRPLRIIKQ